ncbi:MAG: hypothetical protein H7244_02350 [Herminiimonas sp.]|nr:hypothetical protein [Herminiimonas sp.]
MLATLLAAGAAQPAFAKLPAASPEAKAKKDEAAAKTAYNDKVAAYKLCLAQDRVAAAYRKGKAAADTTVPPAGDIPACQDPGNYMAAQEATKVGVADSLPLNKEPVKK